MQFSNICFNFNMFEKKRICRICNKSEPEVEFFSRKSSNNGKLYKSSYCKEDERKVSREAKKARYDDPIKGKKMREDSIARTSNPEYKQEINKRQSDKYAIDETFRESVKKKRRDFRASPDGGKILKIRAAKYHI